MRTFLSVFGLLIAIAGVVAGCYVWFVWGWYEGLMLLYDSIANKTGAGDFAYGVIKILCGSTLGVLVFWGMVAAGMGVAGFGDKFRLKSKRRIY